MAKVQKVTQFNRATCRAIAEVAERAVQQALEPYGLKVRVGGGTFDFGSYTMKVEAAVVQSDGFVLTKEVGDFKALATVYGFEEADLGRTFTDAGHTWKVVGLKPTSDKFPVLVEREDGRRFKFPTARVLRGLGRPIRLYYRGRGQREQAPSR